MEKKMKTTTGRGSIPPIVKNQMENGLPKIRGTMLGVPITRIMAFGALYWSHLFMETTLYELPECT